MFLTAVKRLIPDRSMPIRVLGGPFRGAAICMNPHNSLRKIFGLYEHELNSWLSGVLPSVDVVLDVGANDGYFTFGCAAALRRLQRSADILAFEPQAQHCRQLDESLRRHSDSSVRISVEQTLVGNAVGPGITTLNTACERHFAGSSRLQRPRALVKIDVEGAEIDVIEGASNWLRPEHYFLIEVHDLSYLTILEQRFTRAGMALERRYQRPLPILGREHRAESNCWLITQLNGFQRQIRPPLTAA